MANYYIKGKKIYANIEALTNEELQIVVNYKSLGYTLIEESKRGKSKKEMLEDLIDFEEWKNDFETAYSLKAKESETEEYIKTVKELKSKYGIKTKSNTGFHIACQIYSKWKKAQQKEDNK